jgi:hypothetical protein
VTTTTVESLKAGDQVRVSETEFWEVESARPGVSTPVVVVRFTAGHGLHSMFSHLPIRIANQEGK